jgi:hypothetical protein
MVVHRVPLRYFLTSLFSKYQQKSKRGCQQVYKPRETKKILNGMLATRIKQIIIAKLRHFKKDVLFFAQIFFG